MRYVLCSIAPETKDSEFTWKDYQARVNNELVAILGNFANTVAVLNQKYYEGKTPAFSEAHFAEQIGLVRKELSDLQKELCRATEEYRFRDGLAALMNMARAGNKFLAETEPWKLQKTNPEATATAMAFALEILANIAIACEPYLPHTHEKLCAQLNLLPLEFMVRAFWNQGTLLKPFPEGHPLGELLLHEAPVMASVAAPGPRARS